MAIIRDLTAEQRQQFNLVTHAGVDEVGRGPLVGNVVTSAVILDPNNRIDGLNDSKKLTDKKRETLFAEIHQKALAISIGYATPQEIDELNILHATMLAMQRAVAELTLVPELVLVDGNRTPEFTHNQIVLPSHAIIKGDGLVDAISAASIVAKVIRDREMQLLDMEHPEYGFAKHKGYPTKAHFEALELYGVLPEHRRSFKPVRERLAKT